MAVSFVHERNKSNRTSYSEPSHYDIAFGANRNAEVKFLLSCFRAYGSEKVQRVADVACGTGPHALRLATLGYQIFAIDLSRENVAYVAQQASCLGLPITTRVADMGSLELPEAVDAAICLQNSQSYMLTNDDLVRHLRAVARALRPGGLYIFDRFILSSWTNPVRSWSWSRRRRRIVVRASFSTLNDVDPVTQIFRERLQLEVTQNGTRRVHRQTLMSRMVFPQELRTLVELAGGLEFVEWFYGFKLHQRLDQARHPLMMIIVLRKKGGRG